MSVIEESLKISVCVSNSLFFNFKKLLSSPMNIFTSFTLDPSNKYNFSLLTFFSEIIGRFDDNLNSLEILKFILYVEKSVD